MIYTIGHSTHAIETFLALLARHNIAAIADVRSAPFSRRNPQFTRSNLERSLDAANIAYRFFGKELGARSEDPSCYRKGKVQYELLAQTALFRRGLGRLAGQAAQQTTAILCAGKEPLECHRTILVARHLDMPVAHIHADARIEPHPEALGRLIRQLRLPPEDMFRTHDDVIAEAYRLQGERIAYTRPASQGDMMSA
ncbi:MAG: DUF488 domain-containing protein [Bryobacterales bacterium]|nr:DUF488 domain-containing protein [Bryobacterales bacterium]